MERVAESPRQGRGRRVTATTDGGEGVIKCYYSRVWSVHALIAPWLGDRCFICGKRPDACRAGVGGAHRVICTKFHYVCGSISAGALPWDWTSQAPCSHCRQIHIGACERAAAPLCIAWLHAARAHGDSDDMLATGEPSPASSHSRLTRRWARVFLCTSFISPAAPHSLAFTCTLMHVHHITGHSVIDSPKQFCDPAIHNRGPSMPSHHNCSVPQRAVGAGVGTAEAGMGIEPHEHPHCSQIGEEVKASHVAHTACCAYWHAPSLPQSSNCHHPPSSGKRHRWPEGITQHIGGYVFRGTS